MIDAPKPLIERLNAGCKWQYDGYGGDNMVVDTDTTDGVMFEAAKALTDLMEAAEAVVWFDWSNNDSDAVAAIEKLRALVETTVAT